MLVVKVIDAGGGGCGGEVMVTDSEGGNVSNGCDASNSNK